MKKATLALLGTLLATPAFAAEIGGQEVSVTVGTDVVSEYVFRGVSFADASVQPYAEASIGNFTIGTWANLPFTEDSDIGTDEIDLYASYGFDLGETVSASVGATYYHFPEGDGGFFGTDNGNDGTYEVNAGVALDYALSPFATAYYDFTLEAFTLEGGVSHGLATSDRSSLDLGLTAGLVDADGGGDYEYATVSAGWSFALTDDAALTAGANYSISSEDSLGFSRGTLPTGERFAFTDKDNLFWWGLGLSAGF